ncbi:MAG: TlpA family protein disulfide reductase, partial [Deltaproteobacteria bacterium]|nr:TlpA family protein disulfide reductase [Deltaproteobacteria bacterium]
MYRTRTSLALVLAFFVWVAPGFGAEDDTSEPPKRLSAFELGTLDLQTYSSAQRLGDRPAVITFWRVDQEPSVRILKDLKQLFAEDTKHEVAIVSIVAGAVERPLVESLVKELEIAFPVLLDPERRVYAELGVIVSPTTWFIDRNGVVIDSY